MLVMTIWTGPLSRVLVRWWLASRQLPAGYDRSRRPHFGSADTCAAALRHLCDSGQQRPGR